MKKNSRKYRKLQKEQTIRTEQALQKAGAPFSRHKIRECRHKYLHPISDTECQCSECKVIFPIELYEKSRNSNEAVSREILEMSLRTVRYYYVAEDEIEYLKPEEDPLYEEEEITIKEYIKVLYRKDETTGKLVERPLEDLKHKDLEKLMVRLAPRYKYRIEKKRNYNN